MGLPVSFGNPAVSLYLQRLILFAMSTQFISDEQGNKISIVIPIREYNLMMEELEEFHDIKLYDEAKGRNEKTLLLADYLKKRKKTKKHA